MNRPRQPCQPALRRLTICVIVACHPWHTVAGMHVERGRRDRNGFVSVSFASRAANSPMPRPSGKSAKIGVEAGRVLRRLDWVAGYSGEIKANRNPVQPQRQVWAARIEPDARRRAAASMGRPDIVKSAPRLPYASAEFGASASARSASARAPTMSPRVCRARERLVWASASAGLSASARRADASAILCASETVRI